MTTTVLPTVFELGSIFEQVTVSCLRNMSLGNYGAPQLIPHPRGGINSNSIGYVVEQYKLVLTSALSASKDIQQSAIVNYSGPRI